MASGESGLVTTSDFELLKGVIRSIQRSIDDLKVQLSSEYSNHSDQQSMSSQGRVNRGQYRGDRIHGRNMGGFRNFGNHSRNGFVPGENRSKEPVCHRCGQIGHLKIGCRVQLGDLNEEGSAALGKQ